MINVDVGTTRADLVRSLCAGGPEFAKLQLENFTLSWPNLTTQIKISGKSLEVPFEIGADILYEKSQPVKQNFVDIGNIIRQARKKAKLTQEELATRCGTTTGYISRLETNKSGIELHTLEKIVTLGLHKKLRISVE